MPTFRANVFTPRFGHDDVYDFEFERDTLKISHGMRGATATYRENFDPEWTGEHLHRILKNDSIAPPEAFQSMIEYLWLKWRGGEISTADAEMELQTAIFWLNEVTRLKPRTDFWRGYF